MSTGSRGQTRPEVRSLLLTKCDHTCPIYDYKPHQRSEEGAQSHWSRGHLLAGATVALHGSWATQKALHSLWGTSRERQGVEETQRASRPLPEWDLGPETFLAPSK